MKRLLLPILMVLGAGSANAGLYYTLGRHVSSGTLRMAGHITLEDPLTPGVSTIRLEGVGGEIRATSGTFTNTGNDAFAIVTSSGINVQAGGVYATFLDATTLNLSGLISIAGGVPGAGKVLTDVGGTGLATWETPSGGGHGDGTNASSGKLCLGVDANGNCQEGNVDQVSVDSSTAPVSSDALFDHDADVSAHHIATVDSNASTLCTGTELLNGSGSCVGAGGGHGDGTNAPSGKFTLGVDANGNSQNGTVDASAVDSSTNPVQSNALFDHNALTGDGAHGATKAATGDQIVVRETDGSINISSAQMSATGLVDFGRIYYDATGIRKDQSVIGASSDLNLEAPRTNVGQGSSINIVAATAEAGGFGGDIHLSAGAGNSNRGGEITLLGGVTSNCANTVSGDISLTGGANESTTATGAQVLVKGAITDGDCTADAAGGDLTLKGGNADALIGGDVFIDGGTGSTQGDIIIGTVNTLTDVGIGIVTPAEKLDVSGNIQLTGNLLVGGTVDGVDVAVHAADASAHHPQTTTLAHSALSGVGSSDHHSKTVSSEIDHDSIAGVSADDHHAESHTVASHSDTTATGAELETLTDGSNADSLHAHSGGGGSSVLSAVKSVDEVDTTQVLQDDDELFVSLLTNTSYYISLVVMADQVGNNGDPKFGFSFPATWTMVMNYEGSENGSYAAGRITASGDNGDFFGANNGATHTINFDGIVNTAGGAGTFQFQFSMNAGGTSVTVLEKSFIRAEAF